MWYNKPILNEKEIKMFYEVTINNKQTVICRTEESLARILNIYAGESIRITETNVVTVNTSMEQ